MGTNATQTIDVRMGSPADLAHAAAKAYRPRRSWFANLALFLVAPLFVLAAVLALHVVAATQISKVTGLDERFHQPPPGDEAAFVAMSTFLVVLRFAPFILTAAIFCWLTIRRKVSSSWGWMACSLIAIFALAFVANISPPSISTKGSLTLGFGLGSQVLRWSVLPQFLAPFAVAALMLRHRRRTWQAT